MFTPKVALVPKNFFAPEKAREALQEAVRLSEDDIVEFAPVPQYNAVLVYSTTTGKNSPEDGSQDLPELWYILRDLPQCTDYNKILCSWSEGFLYMAVAQGGSLLLANAFKAEDFTTAEYFIFLVLKRLQLNPEVSTICFRTALSYDQEMALYRYFKAVEPPQGL